MQSYLNVPPQLTLHPDSTVRTCTIGNLSLNSLIDTGCHKTLLNKEIYDANISLFVNIYKVPFLVKHTIIAGNGQQLIADFILALPILIQNHWFEFLVLVVDVLDEYDFIICLESIIQLEATYYLTSHILTIEP